MSILHCMSKSHFHWETSGINETINLSGTFFGSKQFQC